MSACEAAAAAAAAAAGSSVVLPCVRRMRAFTVRAAHVCVHVRASERATNPTHVRCTLGRRPRSAERERRSCRQQVMNTSLVCDDITSTTSCAAPGARPTHATTRGPCWMCAGVTSMHDPKPLMTHPLLCGVPLPCPCPCPAPARARLTRVRVCACIQVYFLPVGQITQQHARMALQLLLQFDMVVVLEQVRDKGGRGRGGGGCTATWPCPACGRVRWWCWSRWGWVDAAGHRPARPRVLRRLLEGRGARDGHGGGEGGGGGQTADGHGGVRRTPHHHYHDRHLRRTSSLVNLRA